MNMKQNDGLGKEQSSPQKYEQKQELKIKPEFIQTLTEPAEYFLCSLEDNIYNIQFIKFQIRDYDTGITFLQLSREDEQQSLQKENMNQNEIEKNNQKLQVQENDFDSCQDSRAIYYQFPTQIFDMKRIGAQLTFTVGNKPVKNFQMIERHYFRNQLIQSFEFNLPFCMPNSTNTWETIYQMSNLSQSLIQKMILNPYQTMSDSFYFVDGELIIHNKAEYCYEDFEENQ